MFKFQFLAQGDTMSLLQKQVS